VEISATEAYLFPYQHLATASLIHRVHEDTLRIAYSTHDVEISGTNLWELLVAIQDFAVKWIRIMPQRYQGASDKACRTISEIAVKPAA
jgi:hypothetical protein